MKKEDISALDRELFSELIESPINPLLFISLIPMLTPVFSNFVFK